MAELEATLDDLDSLIRSARPELYGRLRPGLSVQDIDRLAEGLRPYYLPSDLVTLYRWHDGWDDYRDGAYCGLLPDATFNSLAEGIAQYRSWWDALGAEGWHPLWFPAFGDQSGELVALQLEAGCPAGGVLAYHASDDLHTSYDSVETLFATTLACWRDGLLPHDPASFPPGIRAVIGRHNPRSRTPDGGYRRTIARFSTTDWPQEWKDVLGLEPLLPSPDELVVTLAEFQRDPLCGRPVRGEVRGWGGSIDTTVATVSDASGSVLVLLSRAETEGFRELAGGERFELHLAPLEDRGELDRLARDMAHLATVPPVAYVARRAVPL